MKIIIFIMFIGSLTFSCNRSATPPAESQNSIDTSDTFEIIISQGGGFTGGITGYSLHSGGTVESWSHQPGEKAKVTGTYEIDPSKIRKIEKELRESGISSVQSNERGNYTYQLKWISSDSIRTWTWTSTENLPKKFNEWLKVTTAYCSSLQ